MFVIARACLLWALVSLHVVGGAALFRRLFPRESPWLGFVAPALTVELLLNFVEHGVAIPTLTWLLPFTTLGAIWLLLGPVNWRVFRLPTGVFLGSFAFTLLLRALKPDITPIRDAIFDLHLIANFCMGGTLPATSTWLPPIQLTNYYALQQYGASILIRLFGLDVGTGYNVSVALLSALILFLAAAAGWRLSHQRWGVAVFMAAMTACGATGATLILFPVLKDYDPEDSANLFNRVDDPDMHVSLLRWLDPVSLYGRHELFPPGSWAWTGIFHSTAVGQVLTVLEVYVLIELFRSRRNDWPWILVAALPPVILVSSSWAAPQALALALAGIPLALYLGRRPLNHRFVLSAIGAVFICLTPNFLYFLDSPVPGGHATGGEEHTQVVEFLILWWPIFLPWLAFFFVWPRLHPAVQIVHLVLPLGLLGTEYYTVGVRSDMTGKCWGFLYAAAWCVFLPCLLMQRGFAYRAIVVCITLSSLVSFCCLCDFYDRTIWNDDVFQLEGKGALRTDPTKGRLLVALAQFHHKTILTGEVAWAGCVSPLLANYTGNSDFVTWALDCDTDVYRNTYGEANRRAKIVNEIYAGTCDEAVDYLRQNNISAVVIWPDDNVPDAALARMRKQLAPGYFFTNFRDQDRPDPPNVGIFTLRVAPPEHPAVSGGN